MWEVIKRLVAGGTSLLLTTQYLEEADLLADNIVVIDHGRVIAEGTADALKSQVGGERLEITVSDEAHFESAVTVLTPLSAGEVTVEAERRSIVVPVTGGAAVLADALRRLDAQGVPVDDVGLRRPTLDDVFLSLTGHTAEVEPEKEGATPR
jgi:ABC-2 type transport system ATP-binding protein